VASSRQRNAIGAAKRKRTEGTARAPEIVPEIDEIGHATATVIDDDHGIGVAEIVETDGVRVPGTSDQEIDGLEIGIDVPGIGEIAGIETTGIAAKERARAAAVAALSKCWQTFPPLEVTLAALLRLEMPPRRQRQPQIRQKTAEKDQGSPSGVASPTTCPTG